MTLQAPDIAETGPPQAISPAISLIARIIARLRREDSGQDIIEYALAAALIGLTAVSSLDGLAVNISNSFDNVSNAVANAIPADSTGSPAAPTPPSNGGGNNNGGHRGGGGDGFGGFGGFHHHH